MKCPECKNRGFLPSDDVKKPIQQIKTDKYSRITHRRYICLQCGYKWITVEKFERAVELKSSARNNTSGIYA
ncbi:MAG: hypothetical protein SCALA702_25570 [Melioribacteraceae bacterium]|nr:MAG: hypothetical protein SCALA702_25570 [Melioribacteraceae bacterium]